MISLVPYIQRICSAYLRRRAAKLLRSGALREVTFADGNISGLLPCWLHGNSMLDVVAPPYQVDGQMDDDSLVDFASCDTAVKCSICLDGFAEHDWRRKLPCAHAFHAQCIEEWVQQPGGDACPLCRTHIHLRGRTRSEARVEQLELWQLKRLVRLARAAIKQAERQADLAGRAEGALQRRSFPVCGLAS